MSVFDVEEQGKPKSAFICGVIDLPQGSMIPYSHKKPIDNVVSYWAYLRSYVACTGDADAVPLACSRSPARGAALAPLRPATPLRAGSRLRLGRPCRSTWGHNFENQFAFQASSFFSTKSPFVLDMRAFALSPVFKQCLWFKFEVVTWPMIFAFKKFSSNHWLTAALSAAFWLIL